MSATIGTVTLPYGVQEEGKTTNNTLSVTTIPLGSPVIQVMGRQAEEVSIKTTVSAAIYADLLDQMEGCPMVSFNAGGDSDTDYGIIIESIENARTSKFPDYYELDITAYKLDFTVANTHYDLSVGAQSLATSATLTTGDTDEVVDDYTVRLILSSTKTCMFKAQTSDDEITWTDYPDSLGWELNAERRVIDVSHLIGYLRVYAENTGATTTSITIDAYLTI